MDVVGLIINEEKDNVAVVTEDVGAGDMVICQKNGGKIMIQAAEEIPVYHKISLKPLEAGDVVLKYGEAIGRMQAPVKKGGYIHIHNLGGLGGEES